MEQRFNLWPRSIRGHLIVLVAALVVPLVALQVWWGYDHYRQAQDTVDNHALVLADATATSMRRFLELSEGLLADAADRLVEQGLDAGCDEDVLHVADHYPLLFDVSVTRADGSLVCAATRPEYQNRAIERPWVAGSGGNEMVTIGDPVMEPSTGTWVLPMWTPLVADGGGVLGNVVGTLELLDIAELLGGSRVDHNQLVTITTADRIVVARSHDAPRFVGRRLNPFTGYDVDVGPGLQVARGPDFEGIERSWGQVSMANGWVVYVGVPTAMIIAPLQASLLRRAGATLLILVIGMGLAGASYHRVGRALRELVGALRSADSDRSVSSPEATPLEIRDVVAQFNEVLAHRDEAREQEKKVRERFQAIFDNAAFGIYVSMFDGRLVEANRALVEMLGYDTVDELLQQEAYGWCADARRREEIRSEARLTGRIDNREAPWKRRDGTPITVRLNGRTIRAACGDPAVEVMVQDVTDEKRAHDQLRQSQKMGAIGQLAGGIAHDFNNLLTVISGNLELLEGQLAAPEAEAVRTDLESIRQATTRATALTRGLLAFSRDDGAAAHALDVNRTLSDMQRLLRRLIREDIRLRTELDPSDPVVVIAPAEIEQVVMNLVLNARDAMPDGGEITIATRVDDDEGEHVLLEVSDTGVGMPRHVLERALEPFYTSKPPGAGNGLGLSTVQRIAERAGGSVTLRSEPGEGTTVRLVLPRAPALEAPESVQPARTVADGGSERVLVVEDEELVRAFVRRSLEGAGYDVAEAADGSEALEIIGQLDDPVDLVITDLVMPNVKGTELAVRLRERLPDTPVLVMSGYAAEGMLESLPDGTATAMLTKPFEVTELRRKVRSVLDARAAEREPVAQGD